MSLALVQCMLSVLFVLIVFKMILPAKNVEQITLSQLHERLQEEKGDTQFIDVRPRRQYEQFHVFGFRNIPLKDLRRQATTLDKNKPIVTICQTGVQGNRACKRLKRYGFTQLANVRGGLSTWEPFYRKDTEGPDQ